jgi:F0F1-type ATP synthase assembly protein I
VTDRRGEEDESKGPRSRQAAAYQGSFEAVFAILIAAVLGDLADDHFGTGPRYLLVGFAIGFGSFVLRLVKLGRYLQETAPDSDSKSNDE